ncbi:MAG TPA: M20/M25/M40 family metallo-hydrolase [Anaerolineaceae bacterium]|nr:M20/M25/M40 family metallo-hydrolase [Anaerolineaceae bacterium]
MTPLLIAGLTAGALLLIILAVILIRTLGFPLESEPTEALALMDVDGEAVARRIGLAVQCRTISRSDPTLTDPRSFTALHELLRTLYPQLHEKLDLELVNDRSLLYTWRGSDPALDPICFAAHQDVVPADEAPEAGWTHPPFAGELADGYVWGRGTLDCKGTLIGLCEAATNLLKSGFSPRRTIYLAFGADEEVSGLTGARAIAELLKERGVRLAFLLDEGSAVTKGSAMGVNSPIGQIGISEKGYLSLKLKAKVKGGHSATPPKQTAVGALALAIAVLEANPFPQNLDVMSFIASYLGKDLPFLQRMQYANTWLFGGALKRKLAETPLTNALTRTTIAPTIIKAGSAENVLPAEAEALLNLRIMPGETLREVYERVNDLVGDENLEVLPAHGETLENEHAWNPTPVADVDSPQYQRLAELVRATFPGAIVVPFMMAGATDARHYAAVCQNAMRFSPLFLTQDESQTMHAVDERLSFINASRMVAFYEELMRQESSLLDEEEERGEVEAPLKVKSPSRKERRAAAGEEMQEAPAEPAELPLDDEPLVVKPLRKEE